MSNSEIKGFGDFIVPASPAFGEEAVRAILPLDRRFELALQNGKLKDSCLGLFPPKCEYVTCKDLCGFEQTPARGICEIVLAPNTPYTAKMVDDCWAAKVTKFATRAEIIGFLEFRADVSLYMFMNRNWILSIELAAYMAMFKGDKAKLAMEVDQIRIARALKLNESCEPGHYASIEAFITSITLPMMKAIGGIPMGATPGTVNAAGLQALAAVDTPAKGKKSRAKKPKGKGASKGKGKGKAKRGRGKKPKDESDEESAADESEEEEAEEEEKSGDDSESEFDEQKPSKKTKKKKRIASAPSSPIIAPTVVPRHNHVGMDVDDEYWARSKHFNINDPIATAYPGGIWIVEAQQCVDNARIIMAKIRDELSKEYIDYMSMHGTGQGPTLSSDDGEWPFNVQLIHKTGFERFGDDRILKGLGFAPLILRSLAQNALPSSGKEALLSDSTCVGGALLQFTADGIPNGFDLVLPHAIEDKKKRLAEGDVFPSAKIELNTSTLHHFYDTNYLDDDEEDREAFMKNSMTMACFVILWLQEFRFIPASVISSIIVRNADWIKQRIMQEATKKGKIEEHVANVFDNRPQIADALATALNVAGAHNVLDELYGDKLMDVFAVINQIKKDQTAGLEERIAKLKLPRISRDFCHNPYINAVFKKVMGMLPAIDDLEKWQEKKDKTEEDRIQLLAPRPRELMRWFTSISIIEQMLYAFPLRNHGQLSRREESFINAAPIKEGNYGAAEQFARMYATFNAIVKASVSKIPKAKITAASMELENFIQAQRETKQKRHAEFKLSVKEKQLGPHFIWLVGGQRTQFPSMNVEMTVFYRHIDENAPTGAGLTEGKLMWFKKETTDKLSKGKASIHEAAFNKLFLRVERFIDRAYAWYQGSSVDGFVSDMKHLDDFKSTVTGCEKKNSPLPKDATTDLMAYAAPIRSIRLAFEQPGVEELQYTSLGAKEEKYAIPALVECYKNPNMKPQMVRLERMLATARTNAEAEKKQKLTDSSVMGSGSGSAFGVGSYPSFDANLKMASQAAPTQHSSPSKAFMPVHRTAPAIAHFSPHPAMDSLSQCVNEAKANRHSKDDMDESLDIPITLAAPSPQIAPTATPALVFQPEPLVLPSDQRRNSLPFNEALDAAMADAMPAHELQAAIHEAAHALAHGESSQLLPVAQIISVDVVESSLPIESALAVDEKAGNETIESSQVTQSSSINQPIDIQPISSEQASAQAPMRIDPENAHAHSAEKEECKLDAPKVAESSSLASTQPPVAHDDVKENDRADMTQEVSSQNLNCQSQGVTTQAFEIPSSQSDNASVMASQLNEQTETKQVAATLVEEENIVPTSADSLPTGTLSIPTGTLSIPTGTLSVPETQLPIEQDVEMPEVTDKKAKGTKRKRSQASSKGKKNKSKELAKLTADSEEQEASAKRQRTSARLKDEVAAEKEHEAKRALEEQAEIVKYAAKNGLAVAHDAEKKEESFFAEVGTVKNGEDASGSDIINNKEKKKRASRRRRTENERLDDALSQKARETSVPVVFEAVPTDKEKSQSKETLRSSGRKRSGKN